MIVTDTTNEGLDLLLNAYAWIRSAGQSSGSSDVNAEQQGVFLWTFRWEYNSHSSVLRRSTSPDVEGNRLAYSFIPVVLRAVQEDAFGHVGSQYDSPFPAELALCATRRETGTGIIGFAHKQETCGWWLEAPT